MNLARYALVAAAAAVCVTATQRPAAARAFDSLHQGVHGVWPGGTVGPNNQGTSVPGPSEFNSVGEVDVTKSSNYHCETKLYQGAWFRSSCTSYANYKLVSATCKTTNGDPCYTYVDPSGNGQKASITARLNRNKTYKFTFVWTPGNTPYDLTVAVDPMGGAQAGF